MEWRVPLFDLDYGEEERAAVDAVLVSRWLTMGERTREFEERFAAYTGAKHAVAVANGTAALHLAMLAAGVGPGDEVIVPDLTFIATANAVVYAGGIPVLADVLSADDLTIDPSDIRRKITPRTKAIAPMHYAGFACRMAEIAEIAREFGLAVVEDCAHAPGARYAGTHAGRFGVAGCFSFFSNKNLATGEGGMVVTDDDEVAETVRSLRTHGMTSTTVERDRGHARGYDVTRLGFNYRLTEIEAALGIVQLGKVDRDNAERRRAVAEYRRLLADVDGISVPFAAFDAERPDATVSAGHIQTVLLPEGYSRDEVVERLTQQGIQTSVHYRPIHTFTSEHVARMSAEGLERVSALAPRLLTLPLHPALSDAHIAEVVDALARSVH